MKRRHFLVLQSAAIGGALVYTLDRRAQRVSAQSGVLRVPLRYFTRTQALDVAAAATRIFPADETGPGASEAGVVIYIDRQLAGPYGRGRYRYSQPPFDDGPPELGYQGRATPREIYAEGLPSLRGIADLPPERQDALLRSIETTRFFALLRTHTIEGMFCDPIHGGNRDLIGWQLIGFPGPRMSYLDEVESYHGRAFRPKPESLEQILGRPVRPSEEEV